MAIQSRATLKSFFETNDYPTQEQFWELIESLFHKNEDSLSSEKATYVRQGIANVKQALDDLYLNSGSTAITTLRDGVTTTGDTLKKLYDLIEAIKGGDNTNTINSLAMAIANILAANTGDETTQSILTKIGDGLIISAAYLPGYVDDVIEGLYVNATTFNDAGGQPITLVQGKIYVSTDNNTTYRWSGSALVSLSNPLAYATQAEAEGNVENTKVMTALRVFQNWIYNITNYVIAGLTTTNKTIIGAINELKAGKRDANLIDITIHFRDLDTYVLDSPVAYKITTRTPDAGLTVSIKKVDNSDYIDNTNLAAFEKLYVTGNVAGKSVNLKGVML